MRKIAIPLGLLLVLIVVASLLAAYSSSASPSENFYAEGEAIFDDWDICRTRAYGEDGFFQITGETTFRPVITLESLDENADRAYELGEQFVEEYPDPNQRAEQIFYFVRDKVRYTPDVDQFDFEEFAINADELITTIDERGIARGDCEDMTILLAVIYKGAGYRSAIVLPPGHAAALVYIPEYKKANLLTLDDEAGWVWAEATGRNNRFGWIPDEYRGERLAAYEVSSGEMGGGQSSTGATTQVAITGGNIAVFATPFITVIFLMWILSMFRRKKRS